jgi:hypothetical protein
VALVIGAFVGGARWLIVPALAIALPVGTVSAAGIELEGGYGQRHYEPISAEAIPEEYELAAGQLLIDLRELDWDRERVVDVDVDQGFGQMVIAIPEDVCLQADADVAAGTIDLDGNETAGFDVDDSAGIGSTETPRLSLDAELDAGQILVIGDDDAVLERDWDDRGDTSFGRASAPTECAA